MDREILKLEVAKAALAYVPEGAIIGIGSGSTMAMFIKQLGLIKSRIEAAVASSEQTATLLKEQKIPVLELNDVGYLPVYFDSADAVNSQLQLVKGGGGALTQEKILAAASHSFICLVDESKLVKVLGEFPVAVEVLPMARSFVAREIVKLKGSPSYRSGFITDNGNMILDIHNWTLERPLDLENKLNQIPGVIANGIFAQYRPELLLVANNQGVKTLNSPF